MEQGNIYAIPILRIKYDRIYKLWEQGNKLNHNSAKIAAESAKTGQ